ncbi:2Fe-2S iron-sulfur cluster binding domain-containing protein [Quadrisphaera granulorum]|uniref:2Fe-2S iron-sulfur cluster protein n=1 Tax=Quadrisphaera granulorum TaxID=317664 RepID=A0A316AAG7_9ACTN|nr:2Fe-2S iron-sulfur cluster-binding protein [Quadrisphaera granulorum]PWJ54178.1 2Fe-2S iron-sulfur cluster protein [Quadrisphaera granulorum]SZE96317.1 2Fe-2S iron-sulfur cluster binding domain-containing protein [Quadrisphaera granulorum]
MGPDQPAPARGTFSVVLQRTGRVLDVPDDRSILDVVEQVVDVPFTCRAGDCGSCVTTLLAGTPDYRNTVLSPRARAAGRRIALCVDRSLTPTLELDL